MRPAERVEAARGLDRAGGVEREHGADRVDPVDAPVHEVPVAVGLLEPPVEVPHLRAVGQLRGGTAPRVPVEARRGGDRARVLELSRGRVVDLGGDGHDPPRVAGRDVLPRLQDRGALSPLEAHLDDAPARLRRLHHRPALAHVVGEGLLAVDVEAPPAGLDEGQRVPVGRGGDDHRLQPRHVEELPVVLEGPRRLSLRPSHLLRGLREVLAVDVAQGNDLDTARLEGGVEDDTAVPAAADHAEADALLRSLRAARPADGQGPCGQRSQEHSTLHACPPARGRSYVLAC